jgi:hypothetical protein
VGERENEHTHTWIFFRVLIKVSQKENKKRKSNKKRKNSTSNFHGDREAFHERIKGT